MSNENHVILLDADGGEVRVTTLNKSTGLSFQKSFSTLSILSPHDDEKIREIQKFIENTETTVPRSEALKSAIALILHESE